jgi:uncharacterized oligopeptide transporter (OPT) family protein
MKKVQVSKNNSQFIGVYFVSYVVLCGLIMGKILTPIAFFLWLFIGWGISRFLSDMFVVGSDVAKTSACAAIYLSGLSAISFLRFI